MASHQQKVLVGQKAALCALLLAGQPFVKTCQMLGVPERAMKTVLPADWHRGKRPGTKWTPSRLKELKTAYLDERVSRETVARLFGMSRDMLKLLAAREGWKRSRRQKPTPTRIEHFTRDEKARFKRLSSVLGAVPARAIMLKSADGIPVRKS